MNCVVSCAILLLSLSTSLCASIVTIDRNSRGSYDSGGGTNDSGYINEFVVGRVASGLEARNWLRFDFSVYPVIEGTILSASLRIQINDYVSPDGFETYELHEVTSDPSQLGLFAGTDVSRDVFADLGDGLVYGARTIVAADEAGALIIPLNSTAVDALNAAIHGPGGSRAAVFVVGGRLTTLGDDRGVEAIVAPPNRSLLDIAHNTNLVSELILEVNEFPGTDPGIVLEPVSLVVWSFLAFVGSGLAGEKARRTVRRI